MLENRSAGVTVAWQGSTIEGFTAIAGEADRLGFEYFWVPEAWGTEAFSVASYLLSKTSKIRVGTGILNIFSRSAALIGMGYATLDQLAPGRFILGLGSSGKALVENFHGVDFSNPLERTEEYVAVIRRVAQGETLDYNGKVVKNLSRFRLYTKPMSHRLEIYLGAIGDSNLNLAGRICDGAILAEYPSSKLIRALGLLDSKDKKLFTYLHTCISNSKEELEKSRHVSAKNIAFYIASMGSYYAKSLARLGHEEEVKKIIEAHQKNGSDGATKAVSEGLVDELSLIGTPDMIKEKISHFPEGVIPVLAFRAVSNEDVATAINSMRNLLASG